MKKMMFRILALGAPGLVLGWYLNVHHMAMFERAFNPDDTWFFIGIGYVLAGGMFCIGPHVGSNGYLYQRTVSAPARLADAIEAETRFSRGLRVGPLILGLGIGFILYSLHFWKAGS
jgi:hypothetical protein